ncbi:MAG TPA: glycosyltransferase [Blastocatellia bacterium]|nr:glycosyltransferase [Blastocatellia bacterium]
MFGRLERTVPEIVSSDASLGLWPAAAPTGLRRDSVSGAPLEAPPPNVSVIVPTYNNSRFVCQALDSIVAQSFRNLEIIVIDDGSTDDTAAALAPYRDLITLVRTRNQGPAAARNAGIKRAKGDFIAFLDSDDLWLPEKLDRQVAHLIAHPEIGIVFCDSETFGGGDHSRCRDRGNPWSEPGAALETLLTHRPIALSSVVVRKSCLAGAGMFDESLRGAEDYNLFLRLSRQFRFGVVDGALVRKRLHEDNLSDDLACMHRDEIANVRKLASLFPKESLHVRRLSGQIHFRFGRYYFDRRDFVRARHCFLSALRNRPLSRWAWIYLAASSLPKAWRDHLFSAREDA